jgi:hypothetical protein
VPAVASYTVDLQLPQLVVEPPEQLADRIPVDGVGRSVDSRLNPPAGHPTAR